jgi:hypothetical protein
MTGHPAQYSQEVLDVIAPMILPRDHVHDPFAGTGHRLGALCDTIGATYTGADIETWEGHDPRVTVGNARDPMSYPAGLHVVVTSPVYVNKRLADYPNGPTPDTKTKGRRDYALSLGRPLHPDNFARYTGRPARAHTYWDLHAEVAKLWPRRVIVNVDEPIGIHWCNLLMDAGYRVSDVRPAVTRRYGGLDNADKRATCEIVIVAERG